MCVNDEEAKEVLQNEDQILPDQIHLPEKRSGSVGMRLSGQLPSIVPSMKEAPYEDGPSEKQQPKVLIMNSLLCADTLLMEIVCWTLFIPGTICSRRQKSISEQLSGRRSASNAMGMVNYRTTVELKGGRNISQLSGIFGASISMTDVVIFARPIYCMRCTCGTMRRQYTVW